MGVLSYIFPPVVSVTSMYVGFSIFNPEKKQLVLYVYTALAITCEIRGCLVDLSSPCNHRHFHRKYGRDPRTGISPAE